MPQNITAEKQQLEFDVAKALYEAIDNPEMIVFTESDLQLAKRLLEALKMRGYHVVKY